ncbi:MAG: nucleoside triphosphate pyrophosphohydrolase [Sneathiellaceae bacterium]
MAPSRTSGRPARRPVAPPAPGPDRPAGEPDTAGQVRQLLSIMARLRDPDGGCPWDLEQDFASIAPYTIEEAYEVADAIERDSMDELRDELGDLLLQVVFHSRMAEEAGHFAFADVVAAISDKMLRRHPHVFGDAEVSGSAAQTVNWEALKAAERAAKADGAPAGTLDGIPAGLPAMMRALKLQKRAARVGFDWPSLAPVWDKLDEEVAELRQAAAGPPTADGPAPARRDRIEDELGDVLFVMVNLARHWDIDPDAALRRTNAKFERRFRRVEALLQAEGRTPQDADLAEMDRLWDQAKSEE